MRLGIVASRFNEEICGKMVERARAEAQKLKAECTVIEVPGALEIPLALQWLAQSGRFDALVALGAVIRGDTYHFDVVANESARGVMVLMNCSQEEASAPKAGRSADLRLYGIGAQILRDLGVGKMRLMAAPRKMPSMAGFGLEVIGYMQR